MKWSGLFPAACRLSRFGDCLTRGRAARHVCCTDWLTVLVIVGQERPEAAARPCLAALWLLRNDLPCQSSQRASSVAITSEMFLGKSTLVGSLYRWIGSRTLRNSQCQLLQHCSTQIGISLSLCLFVVLRTGCSWPSYGQRCCAPRSMPPTGLDWSHPRRPTFTILSLILHPSLGYSTVHLSNLSSICKRQLWPKTPSMWLKQGTIRCKLFCGGRAASGAQIQGAAERFPAALRLAFAPTCSPAIPTALVVLLTATN